MYRRLYVDIIAPPLQVLIGFYFITRGVNNLAPFKLFFFVNLVMSRGSYYFRSWRMHLSLPPLFRKKGGGGCGYDISKRQSLFTNGGGRQT